ncbi:MAG: pentapeptide repeat-containing protein [Proteobacteria bacterium]|nr:pentapeptide repeat-containing protein [Pseudomonadota bacterium]
MSRFSKLFLLVICLSLFCTVTAFDQSSLLRLKTTNQCPSCGLYGAKLSHANLSHANLSHANLSHANLSHANLSGADLSHANLTGANLTGATWPNGCKCVDRKGSNCK